MFFRLMLLFTIVPLVELALLIELGKLTNVLTTVAIVVSTGAIGAYLARREGLKTWVRIQENLTAGASPAVELVNALLILIAGAVLITPGLLTDLAGFMLLIPAIRSRLGRKLSAYFEQRIVIATSHSAPREQPYDLIDMPPEE